VSAIRFLRGVGREQLALAAETLAVTGTAENLLAWLLFGAVVGLVGAVVMDAAMHRQPDGWTPAFVAAAVLRRSRPDRVSFRDALVVHHVAGGLAGVLYASLVYATATLVGPAVGLSTLVGHLVGVAGVVAFIYAFFAHLVLPRGATGIYEERATAVRGQWLRSSLVFGGFVLVAGLAVVVALL
jgi:hypothetical protein